MQTIGERLEEARKKKGISIREAAEATKIRGDYLQKFEGNQFDIGLSEIYVRGFLRNYASFLKIASDRILNDYAALGRGDGRSKSPVREGYGRTGIAPAAAESAEPAPAPTAEAQPDSPAGRPPARKRSTAPSLPTGPDPAVVFKYVKIGGAVVIGLLLLLILKSLFSGGDAASARTGNQSAGAARGPVLTFTATNTVVISVRKRNPDDTNGEFLLPSTRLAAGESKTIARTGAVLVEANPAENVTIEFDGKRENLGKIIGHGLQQGKLPAPQ